MKETMLSQKELIQLVYHFYPQKISSGLEEYFQSPEWKKFEALQKDKWEHRENWTTVLKRLRTYFPDCWVVDETVPMCLPGYRCQVYPKEFSAYDLPQYQTVIGFVSYLAPIYTVCAFHTKFVDHKHQAEKMDSVFSKETSLYAQKLMDEIEQEFHYGFLPLEKALEQVPDIFVGFHQMGKVRLFHCLFDPNECF